MFTELAEVSRTRLRTLASPNASLVSRWQSSKLPATANARRYLFGLNIVSCASCVGLTLPRDTGQRHACAAPGETHGPPSVSPDVAASGHA